MLYTIHKAIIIYIKLSTRFLTEYLGGGGSPVQLIFIEFIVFRVFRHVHPAGGTFHQWPA